MPAGQEDVARRFYTGVLGIPEVPKPPILAARGGCWFEAGAVRVHLGVEDDFRPARKAHPALVVADLRSFVERTGVDITWAHDIPDAVRGHIADPFGNRIELVDGGRPVVTPTSGRDPFHRAIWARTVSMSRRGAPRCPGRRCAVRRIRYQEIADELRELATSSGAGSLLPSESELSARFGASRVTVRRALELVRDEGLIAARQGFGWFVATEPVRQRLEHLGTIEDQLEGGGRHAERRVTEFAFVAPPERVRAILGVDQVLRVEAAQPRRRRAVRRRHGVVPGRARAPRCPGRTSSGGRSTSCWASRCAGRRRRSAPTRPSRPTPSCCTSPSARRCCAASASRPTPPAARS